MSETRHLTPHFESVDALQAHLEGVFGERNAIALNSIEQCIGLFAVGIREVRQSRRAGRQDLIATSLGRLGARLFTFAQAEELDIRLSEGLEAKYPATGCAYCGQNPCVCGEIRSGADLDWGGVGERANWSLTDWQTYLFSVYGEANARRGFDYVTGRLSDELVEVMALQHYAPRMKSEELKVEYKLEIADLTAWTLATGSIVGVDVQSAIEERYTHGCPTCGQSVCRCTQGDFDRVYDILG